MEAIWQTAQAVVIKITATYHLHPTSYKIQNLWRKSRRRNQQRRPMAKWLLPEKKAKKKKNFLDRAKTIMWGPCPARSRSNRQSAAAKRRCKFVHPRLLRHSTSCLVAASKGIQGQGAPGCAHKGRDQEIAGVIPIAATRWCAAATVRPAHR